MGLIDTLRARRTTEEVQAALTEVYGTSDPSTFPIASPWGGSHDWHRLVVEDVFGENVPINTRSAAMRIPAVARARNLIVSTVCRFDLVARRDGADIADQPTWLATPGPGLSPQQRIAWTVDDLLFYGWSCWWVDRGAEGWPLTARRVARDAWQLNEDMRVEIHGEVVPDQNVIVIPGLHEGILSYGIDALHDARTLYRNVRQRLDNPVPNLELHQTGGRPLTDTEIDALIARWAQARKGQNGGVGYTSENIELKPHGEGGEQLLIEARNAAALDLARVVGVAASRIDSTVDKSSLNYETTQGRNREFTDLDLQLYMTPIVARLSLDDVTPHGQRVRFDTSPFTDDTAPETPAT